MSENNKPEELLNKAKDQVGKMMKNVDKEKMKEFESKFSINQLKRFVQILLVGAVISMGVFTYWNYDHNMVDPSKVKYTNKDSRDVYERTRNKYFDIFGH